ncbi:MAG: hypothetical protein ACXWC9_02295 [Pseudobdellovibrionaceae bacterium]
MMKNKVQQVFILLLAAYTLSACQKVVGYSGISIVDTGLKVEDQDAGFDSDSPAMDPLPGGSSSDPNDDSGNPDLSGEPLVSKLCSDMLTSNESPNLTTVEDIDLISKSGDTLVESARNLSVRSISGSLTVLSAAHVSSIHSISGSVQVNALTIDSVSSISGDYCLKADQIGSITSASGAAQIRAKTIDLLKVTSGTLHIYGAVVNKLESASGNICLHNGAKILNLNAKTVSGVISEDCQ